MKIAISTDGNVVAEHFGRCPSYTMLEMDGDNVVSRSIVENPGHEPGRIPQFLNEQGANYIISGGMGMRAIGFFNEFKIKTILGISGTIDDVIEKLKQGKLEGGESLCNPGAGKGYGVDKTACDHPNEDDCEHEEERSL
ncbi:MAG: NifB/NifX family molybdenum-iron cluster-binding protein [Candidatus Omnitrophica bacterium]|nr:NifB/NifX family molybdenum-iron cluster-binding protein [Candidatus Omnitrophota bacterium]